MITLLDFYHVMTAVVPLYVAMTLAYASVKWWNIFTPDQCSGINRFVALFAIPLLSFHFISINNPYVMNLRFMAADTLQKVILLLFLAVWSNLKSTRGNLDWTITLFPILTLPNTLVVGIPLLTGMYGEFTASLMIQIVVFQSLIWNTFLLFMYEYRGARILISDRFPDTATSIASIRVDSNVTSLDERQGLETEVVVKEDGSLHVNLRRSNASQSDILSLSRQHSLSSLSETCCGDSNVMVVGGRNSSYGARNSIHVQMSSRRVASIDEEVGETLEEKVDENKAKAMPSKMVVVRLILVTVWRKLIRNPNTYSSILGLIWSLISFRWDVKMPDIVAKSISILSDAGLGMAMFSLGLFMALQPRIVACGKSVMMVSMALKFVAGPAVMAATSAAVGLRHRLLRVAVVQAALPLGIVPFVFAMEYNLNANVLSTSVIIGMIITVPIGLVYYIFLDL